MIIFAALTPSCTYKFAQAKAAEPAPETIISHSQFSSLLIQVHLIKRQMK
jgi:hypothetical protein